MTSSPSGTVYSPSACNIPEDRHLDRVPGTGLLSDQRIVDGHSVAIHEAKHLKRGTGKYAHVVLIPQPSDDPRDPYASIVCKDMSTS